MTRIINYRTLAMQGKLHKGRLAYERDAAVELAVWLRGECVRLRKENRRLRQRLQKQTKGETKP